MTSIEPTATQRDFRRAMANLSAGVTVITTDGPAGRAGLTVSAVCSVTDAPPTLLVCVNRRSGNHRAFLENGTVCVNVLASGQEEIARVFAGGTDRVGTDRFLAAAWDEALTGAPVLAGAAAALVGRVVDIVERGSHSVLFVEADRILADESAGGLTYFQRRFHALDAPLPV